MTKIALVTTCLNESDSIIQWMNDVNSQTRSPDEVIVVDAGSTDGTLEKLQAWQPRKMKVRVLVLQRCTVAQGRNHAIQNTDADIIASTDTGCRLAYNWLEEITKPLLDGQRQYDVVGGGYTADTETLVSASAWADYYLKGEFRHVISETFLPSSRTIAYRRNVWEKLGGYPEDLRYAGDDTVFALQILKSGFKQTVVSDALVYWRRHAKFGKYLKEAYNYGRGNGEAALNLGPLVTHTHRHLQALRLFLQSLNLTMKPSTLRKCLSAVTGNHPLAALLIPLMHTLSVYYYNLGYINGFYYGGVHCVNCRSRLSNPSSDRI